INVCRALDIPYLWVDSLCILQDSRADWEVESARMRGVYKSAILVIAAVLSPSAQHGFCRPRP
ncbi:hypothetical protein K469DRAFT_535772, partial [Zopfia rhizophila CBS 207.26]